MPLRKTSGLLRCNAKQMDVTHQGEAHAFHTAMLALMDAPQFAPGTLIRPNTPAALRLLPAWWRFLLTFALIKAALFGLFNRFVPTLTICIRRAP